MPFSLYTVRRFTTLIFHPYRSPTLWPRPLIGKPETSIASTVTTKFKSANVYFYIFRDQSDHHPILIHVHCACMMSCSLELTVKSADCTFRDQSNLFDTAIHPSCYRLWTYMKICYLLHPRIYKCRTGAECPCYHKYHSDGVQWY